MDDYKLVGRIRPVYKGVWNADTAYTVLETVTTEANNAAYIAIKDVPSGTPLSNVEYWGVLIDASGLRGADGNDGNDGVGIESVDVRTSTATGGANRVTITLTDGTSKSFSVYNGKDGARGATGATGPAGAAGFSPTVSVQAITGGNRVTITDANGSQSFDVLNGTGGSGGAGEDGGYYTPSVTDNGDLIWTASKADMPTVTGANVKGPQGDKGETGPQGVEGEAGVGIESISVNESSVTGGTNRITIALTDGTSESFNVKNGKDGARGATGATGPAGADGKDYSFDPTVYGLPVLYITGDTSGMSKDNKVTLNYVYGDLSGTCTMKWQGSSSLAYDKKNYTINFDQAFEAVEGWGTQSKYCLKANYIDHTHARNIVSARLWGQIVASRSPSNSTLAACPNYGAVDGFPIVIVLNDEFHGLYTWNIPKDAWMFGMGSGTQEAVICADDATYPAVDFRVHSNVNGDDHELEYVTDENNAAWVATSLNNVIDLCVNSYGADLDTTIAQYLDWESAIDYYILTVILDGRDMTGKNYIMATWNGTKWVFSAYDMDSTYGLDWDGSALLPPNEGVTFEAFRKNRIMELVYRFKTNALKARYKKLRETVLSEYAIDVAFENFGSGIPSVVLNEDVKKWPSLPSTSVNTTDQILRWLHHRLAFADKWIDEIPIQEAPIAPDKRTGNSVAASIDSTGAVYNGVGYKDGYTINNASNGTESEVAMDGCCITGFIPVTKNTIIKVTTDGWNISPTNSRIIFYNANFKPMAYYTQHGFVGLFNGYTNATAILDKTKQSVTYDAEGMTTLNIAYGANCTDLAYIRIRAVGNGANLAVIREGEIPDSPEIPDDGGYTNLIPTSIDTDGSVYNGIGYLVGSRLNSSGNVVAASTYADSTLVTGYMPFEIGDIVRTYQLRDRLYMPGSDQYVQSNGYISFFDENFVKLDQFNSGGNSSNVLIDASNSSWIFDESTRVTTVNIAWKAGASGVAYFRMSGMFDLVDGDNNNPADSVITVNEEIA